MGTADQHEFTLGVEEEFLLVDSDSRRLRPWAEDVLPRAEQAVGEDGQVDREFKRSQVETGTPVCRTLDELSEEIARLRATLSAAAERAGAHVAAAGTHPFSHWRGEGSEVTPKESYLGLERDYQRLAREKIICGCHVHVGVPDPEAAIQILNRVRPWLPAILAVSVNSPFWLGEDTGYASFRTEIWRRWPTAGTPEPFASRQEYDRLVDVLLGTGGIDDPARVHWDVRPSPRFPTLEFRITDVCLTVDDAVAVAGLVRGLVRTCHAEAVGGGPAPRPRAELLRMATWQAARHGLGGELVDVAGERSVPASEMVDTLLGLLRPALEEHDEWEVVSGLVHQVAQRGTGAARQRRALERDGRLEDVVDLVVGATTSPAGA
ncbi:MAG: carboxylate-amine ligase [Actinomycetota bacterium]|nr:carboxylate-amine ligase [Actinomycetota bacterium]